MYKRKLSFLSITLIFMLCLNWSDCHKVDERLRNMQWWEVSQYFMGILNNGLFTRSFQEQMNENFEWSTHEIDLIKVLDERQKRVDDLFKQTIQGVKKLRDAIVANYKDFKISKPKQHCCDKRKDPQINNGCFFGKGQDERLSANPPENVIKQMKDVNAIYNNEESYFYFSLNDGGVYEYPQNFRHSDQKRCREFDPHVRPWYEFSSIPVPRDIVLLVEFETIADKSLALKTATGILDALGQEDRIAVLMKGDVLDDVNNAQHVEFGVWLVGTARNKDKLKLLLGDTVFSDKNSSNFTSFRSRFRDKGKLRINIQRKSEMVFVQVTNGSENLCLYPRPWKKSELFQPTMIITYVIGNNNVAPCSNISIRQHVVTIKNVLDLQMQKNKFSNFFKWSTYLNNSRYNLDPENDIRISLPFKGYYSRGMIISVTLPIIIDGQFVGVAAKDIRNWISLDHISGHEVSSDSYGFLIDQKGQTLFHPLSPSPYSCIGETCKDSPNFALISNLEQNDEVQGILQSMVNMERGIKFVEGDYIQSTGHSLKHESNPVTVSKRRLAYAWIPLVTIKLSLCTVIPVYNNSKAYNVTYRCTKNEKCKLDFRYHLEIQNPNLKNCSYFGIDVLKNEGLVKFPPWAFQNPTAYLAYQNSSDDPFMMATEKGRKYEDLFVLLKGVNLNSSILLAETAEGLWKTGNPLQCFVGIRYIGTVDGVFLSYPGITLNATYDHRTRPWYQVAMANRQPYQTVSLSFPYKDYFSGGEIITLSAAVDKEFPGWSTTTAVIGGDFSVNFISHHLRKRLKECNGTTVECFLMDKMGYVVLHLNNQTYAKFHLTEIYPEIAKELIQAQALMRDGCHDYEKDAAFLYWFFEMPFEEPTTYFGKGKTAFVIHEIPFTNVYLVAKLANSTERFAPISIKVCNSTCARSPEPPCNVASTTDCTDWDNNLRRRFSRMPACFPTDHSPDNKAKTVCRNNKGENSCFKPNGNENCNLWEPRCI